MVTCDWQHPTASTAKKFLAAGVRLAAVHERQERQALRMDYSMSMRM